MSLMLNITIPSDRAFDSWESRHLLSLMEGEIGRFNRMFLCYGPFERGYKEDGLNILREIARNLHLIRMDIHFMHNHSHAKSVVSTLWKSEEEFLRRVYPDKDISKYRSPHTGPMLQVVQATVEAERRQRAAWLQVEHLNDTTITGLPLSSHETS